MKQSPIYNDTHKWENKDEKPLLNTDWLGIIVVLCLTMSTVLLKHVNTLMLVQCWHNVLTNSTVTVNRVTVTKKQKCRCGEGENCFSYWVGGMIQMFREAIQCLCDLGIYKCYICPYSLRLRTTCYWTGLIMTIISNQNCTGD